MSSQRAANLTPGRVNAVALAVVALAVTTVASLVFPLVTPFLAATGLAVSLLLVRRGHEPVYKITLVVFAVTLAAALAIDLGLLAVSSRMSPPGSAPAR